MKFEYLKEYKTREGNKAICVEYCENVNRFGFFISGKEKNLFPYIVFTNESGNNVFRHSEGKDDVISEWREPIKVEGWVNVYEDESRSFYFLKTNADNATAWKDLKRKACIYVSGEEGKEP